MTTQTLTRPTAGASQRNVEAFLEEATAELRRTIATTSANSTRREAEGCVALLTDHRLSGIDERGLASVIGMLRAGRRIVALRDAAPEKIAAELDSKWCAYNRKPARPAPAERSAPQRKDARGADLSATHAGLTLREVG